MALRQIDKLLLTATDLDLADSHYFYNQLFRSLQINALLVDKRILSSVQTYICDMTPEQYSRYVDEIQHLKITGMQMAEFFSN